MSYADLAGLARPRWPSKPPRLLAQLGLTCGGYTRVTARQFKQVCGIWPIC